MAQNKFTSTSLYVALLALLIVGLTGFSGVVRAGDWKDLGVVTKNDAGKPAFVRIGGPSSTFNVQIPEMASKPVLVEVEGTWDEGDSGSSGQRTNINLKVGSARVFSDTKAFPGGAKVLMGKYYFAIGPTAYWTGEPNRTIMNADRIVGEVSRPDSETNTIALSMAVKVRYMVLP